MDEVEDLALQKELLANFSTQQTYESKQIRSEKVSEIEALSTFLKGQIAKLEKKEGKCEEEMILLKRNLKRLRN